MAKLKGVEIVESNTVTVPEIITYKGAEYVKTDDEAGPGDIVISNGVLDAEKGNYYEVYYSKRRHVVVIEDDIGETRSVLDTFDVYRKEGDSKRLERRVSELEQEVAELKKGGALEVADPRSMFTKDDKVRLLSGGGDYPLNGFENDEVYEVKVPFYDDHDSSPVVKIIGGSTGNGWGYAKAEQLELVCDKEYIAGKGDIVRVTDGYGEIVEGDIGVVTHADGSNCPKVKVGAHEWYVNVELIAPASARVNNA